MDTKKKYLTLYYEWMKTGRLPGGCGLCAEFYNALDYDDYQDFIKYIHPQGEDWYAINFAEYWGSGICDPQLGKFTPLRQTILLFMAAMNGEFD